MSASIYCGFLNSMQRAGGRHVDGSETGRAPRAQARPRRVEPRRDRSIAGQSGRRGQSVAERWVRDANPARIPFGRPRDCSLYAYTRSC
ncbi:hypothetical protein GCM10010203_22010 [Actinomadura yumaensis]